MKRLVEMRTEAGGTLLIEVEENDEAVVTPAPTGRVTRGLAPGQVTEKTQATFEDGMRAVLPAAEAMVAMLRERVDAPEVITLSFGLSLNSHVGVVLASASLTANFSVALTWMRGPGPIPGVPPVRR